MLSRQRKSSDAPTPLPRRSSRTPVGPKKPRRLLSYTAKPAIAPSLHRDEAGDRVAVRERELRLRRPVLAEVLRRRSAGAPRGPRHRAAARGRPPPPCARRTAPRPAGRRGARACQASASVHRWIRRVRQSGIECSICAEPRSGTPVLTPKLAQSRRSDIPSASQPCRLRPKPGCSSPRATFAWSVVSGPVLCPDAASQCNRRLDAQPPLQNAGGDVATLGTPSASRPAMPRPIDAASIWRSSRAAHSRGKPLLAAEGALDRFSVSVWRSTDPSRTRPSATPAGAAVASGKMKSARCSTGARRCAATDYPLLSSARSATLPSPRTRAAFLAPAGVAQR